MTRRRHAFLRLRSIRHLAVTLLFLLVGSGLWYSQEQAYRDTLSWMGVPTWQEISPLSLHRVLRNDGFLVGWSDVRVNPLWVSYLLHEVDGTRIGSRPGFRRDWRTLWPIAPDSYFGSGHDRGHLAPNYAIASVHGRAAQHDTFLMSNITPQRPALNRQLWQRLEEVVIDRFVPRFGVVQVITGPVFAERFLDGALRRVGLVEVPEAFYKIIVVPAETPRALAFLMPQEVRGTSGFQQIESARFGVALYNPVDFYQKVSRAAKYGILFIALTFLTVFLMERMSVQPVHPAQYVLIGVAQCVFFLLLLSFAEQIGFTPAYGLASIATILLLGFYAAASLKLARRSSLLVAVLVLLYATLYFILQSTEYALLAGSILAFLAVAVTMVLTRDERWFPERKDAPAE